jgi:hypothetical protein
MQRDLATSASDLATPLRPSSPAALNNEPRKIFIAVAMHCGFVSQELDLNTSLRLAMNSQASVAVADCASRLIEFITTLSAGLSELKHPRALTVASCIKALGPALVLIPTLGAFRAFLSRAWDFDTVYPEAANQSSWTPGTPDGQCGVSSAWLAETLHKQYSKSSTFCEGSLIFDDQQAENVLDHCWLELNGSADAELVLDLTCDQAQGFDRPIIFHAKSDLDRQGVRYIPRERLSISDLPDSPVWPRYQTLLRNLDSQLP